MMSVTEADIGWSWFLSFGIFYLVTATVCAGVSSRLYSHSDLRFLWIFWVFTFLAILVFAMFLSAFFAKATRATLIGLLVFFVGYFLTLIVNYQTGNPAAIGLISLHPVGAFAYGLQEIGRLEDLGVGLIPSTLNSTDSPSGFTFATAINHFIADCILWGVLTWYFNRVWRSEFGRPLPRHFPFKLSYWCPGIIRAPPSSDSSCEIDYAEGVAVEEPSNALKDQAKEGKGIEISGLRKIFGKKTAVDGLSLQIFSGQITALLGHNGAGKCIMILGCSLRMRRRRIH